MVSQSTCDEEFMIESIVQMSYLCLNVCENDSQSASYKKFIPVSVSESMM